LIHARHAGAQRCWHLDGMSEPQQTMNERSLPMLLLDLAFDLGLDLAEEGATPPHAASSSTSAVIAQRRKRSTRAEAQPWPCVQRNRSDSNS
jgi:hypothetical protein